MYPEQFEDLTHSTPLNKPGVVTLVGCSKDHVLYVRPLTTIIASLNPGAYPLANYEDGFLANEYVTLDGTEPMLNISKDFACQIVFVEKEKPGVQNKSFQYKLLFDIPNDDYTTRGQLIQTFDRREWILIVTEVSGAQRLIGSMERGADFSAALSSGDAIKGPANKFTCGFTWECGPERAFYIAT